MSVRVASDFQGRWSCFWGTTYSLELELFDEYLFRRLGEPPLNATLLVDFNRLAKSLQMIGVEDSRLLRRANRDYLLRGVGLGSGAFHPKTYFFANPKEGVLLVGSGNLTLRGIEEGHEVFARLESRHAEDLSSIRAWRAWMDALVDRIDSEDVARRWLDLKDRCHAWLDGDIHGSRFVQNLDASLLDQLVEDLATPVDELHVMAPFYDRGANAVAELCERLRPHRLSVYLGAGTSVDGASLARTLDKAGAVVSVYAVEPHEFVHAKLIGVIHGDRGRLLSGSANLSNAALIGSQATVPWANVEAGMLIPAGADVIRACFVPELFDVRAIPLEHVTTLAFTTQNEKLALPLKLRSADLLNDRRVRLDVEPALPPDALATAGLKPMPLQEGITEAALELPEGGALIWICDHDGVQLSNRVPLDDPAQLRVWLQDRTSGGERPAGLEASDFDKPIGRMLQFLHERCIFDIDETGAAHSARRFANEDAGAAQGSWDFLDDLLQEELRLDPRVLGYRSATTSGLPEDDEILGLLRLMLERAPDERGLRAVGQPPPDPGGGKGTPWTPERRLQVRLFNVLERWCGTLNDPRFRWIDPSAPTRNFSALMAALYECWEQGYLAQQRVSHLMETLYGSYVRTERGPGYLESVTDDERGAALRCLPAEARALGGALLYAVLQPEGEWRSTIFQVQPFLTAVRTFGVVEVVDQSPTLVERLIDERPTTSALEDRLRWASDYIDDPHWCLKQERELALADVVLTRQSFHPRFGITLAVPQASITSPQLVALARQALAYRGVEGAVMELRDSRLALRLGEPLYAIIEGTGYASLAPLDRESLAELQRSGASFRNILTVEGAVAS